MARGSALLTTNTITMLGRHDGAAGTVTSFCRQGESTTPIVPASAPAEAEFPAKAAVYLRARAWTNNLATDLVVTLYKNGQPALREDGQPVIVTIPAGSIVTVENTEDGVPYGEDDSFDVSLSSTMAGNGTTALVGVVLLAVPNGKVLTDRTLNLTARHNGGNDTTTSYCREGNVSLPCDVIPAPLGMKFPSQRMAYITARTWFNNLQDTLHVRILKNGQLVMKPDGSGPVTINIPSLEATTLDPVSNQAVISYDGPDDTYDIQLSCPAGGVGTFALVAVSLQAQA